MFELMDTYGQQAVIKVIGVGGGGGNVVDHMVAASIEGVEFINANTDSQALKRSQAKTILQLGTNLTKGLGCGANPDIGRQAAVEDRERIAEVLSGADMVFITAGMGGGTGTGAAPVVAQVAKDMNILTVAVVTKPFPFEGRKRLGVAEQGIADLGQYVDSIITIPNEKLLTVLGKDATLLDAFGMAMMGAASATGPSRAREAAIAAVSSPLLEDINISGARGILVNITAGLDMSIGEFEEVGNAIKEFASDDATVVIGTVIEPEMREELRVTVVATGLGQEKARKQPYKVVKTGTGTTDFEDYETPTVIRNRRTERPLATAAEAAIEYLDIPAFLRKQAD